MVEERQLIERLAVNLADVAMERSGYSAWASGAASDVVS